MKLKLFAAAIAGLATAPAFGADYDATEKSPLYELHLRVPATAMMIAPLKEKILALYKADPDKLKNYALTYAKGQTTANGIVLLYGAGQVWPHVLGDFRLAVPASVFAKYFAPQWKAVFAAN